MQHGEVWWAEFDERRPVVLLSGDEASGFRAMQVVAPAGADLSGLGVELAVGEAEGLPFDGVLRVVFPRSHRARRATRRRLQRSTEQRGAGRVLTARRNWIKNPIGEPEEVLVPGSRALPMSVTELRRDFHQYPETGFCEFRTASRAAGLLTDLGWDVLAGPDAISPPRGSASLRQRNWKAPSLARAR